MQQEVQSITYYCQNENKTLEPESSQGSRPKCQSRGNTGDRNKSNTTSRTQLGKSRMWGILKGKWSGFFYQKNKEKKGAQKPHSETDKQKNTLNNGKIDR